MRDDEDVTFRRWLFPVACAGGLIALLWQAAILVQLRRESRPLQVVNEPGLETTPAEMGGDVAELEKLRKDNEELHALRAEAAQHKKALEELPQIGAEYKRLVQEKEEAQARTSALPDEEFFNAAEEKARLNECVQNMKQIGLAARVWSNDNKDVLPADYRTMSNELAHTKVLVCPSDTLRSPAADWNTLGPGNVTYELLSPGVPETDPGVVYTRCPIHGSAGLVDGSVHRLGPECRVAPKEGKWKILCVGYE